MKLKSKNIPIEIRRLVANHFESIRNSDVGSELGDAHLASEVVSIYRPDLKDIAYYQFEVVSPDDKPKGFMLVSTDDHDFPIPHWSMESLPVSTILEEDAKGKGKKGNKIYRVDTLAYVLEDDAGEEVSRVGDMPGLISELPDNVADYAGSISSSESVAEGAGATDEKPENIKHKLKKSEGKAPKPKIHGAKSWQEFKGKFGEAFKQHLELHRKNARKSWDIEKLARKFGEGIFANKAFHVPLLEEGYTFDVMGDGEKFVKTNIIKRKNSPDVIELLCDDPGLGKEVDFSIKIKYDSNEHEKLDFFIVTADVPSNEKNNPEIQEV